MRRQVQAGVHGAQGTSCMFAIDHHGDVALGGALGDGLDVDTGAAERIEHFRRDTGLTRHAVTHGCENRQVRSHIDVLDLPFLQLALERRAHHCRGAFGLVLRNGAADGMLGAALGNEDDRDPLFAQRTEQAMRRARHADHAGAFEIDERRLFDTGDALHRQHRLGSAQISVPTFSGANVLRIQMGMPLPTAGAMVCGWMTFAPKYASSIASL